MGKSRVTLACACLCCILVCAALWILLLIPASTDLQASGSVEEIMVAPAAGMESKALDMEQRKKSSIMIYEEKPAPLPLDSRKELLEILSEQ